MLYDRRIFDGRFKVDNLFRNWCKITKVPPRALQLSGQLVSTTSDRDAGLHRATLKKSKTEHSGKQRKKMTMKLLAVFLLVTVVSVTADPDDDCCQEIPAPASGGPDVECDFTPTCRLKGNCCPDTEVVEMVRQNYTCDVNCLLVKQIHWELRASYLYQAYASYFQRADVSLPGIQKFFAHASLEERSHADYFIDYVNKRGGHVHLGQFDVQNTCETVMVFLQSDNSRLDTEVEERMCICGFVSPGGRNKINKKCPLSRETWMEGLMALEDALAAERFVNGKLLELHKRADKLNDAHLTHILEHDFLEEQVQAIYEIGLYVTRLRKFAPPNRAKVATSNYKLGEYLFDQKLHKSLDEKEPEGPPKRNYGKMA